MASEVLRTKRFKVGNEEWIERTRQKPDGTPYATLEIPLPLCWLVQGSDGYYHPFDPTRLHNDLNTAIGSDLDLDEADKQEVFVDVLGKIYKDIDESRQRAIPPREKDAFDEIHTERIKEFCLESLANKHHQASLRYKITFTRTNMDS